MSITQRVYPKFFEKSLKGTTGTVFNSSTGVLPCKIRLYRGTGAAFVEGHGALSEITGTLLTGTAVETAGSPKDINVTMSLDGAGGIIRFSLSSVTFGGGSTTWPAIPTFKYAIISTTTGDHLVMHLEFANDQNPVGTYTLSQTSGSEFRIDLTP